MGRSHSRAYAENPLTETVAVMDISQEAADRVASEFGIPSVYTDYQKLLAK